jgi:hypothetical protein
MTRPSINLELQWSLLVQLTEDMTVLKFGDKGLGASYNRLLSGLRHDRSNNGTRILGLYRAPASKDRHHDFEGGLIAHLLQMWHIWTGLRSVIRAGTEGTHSQLNDSNVWRAILHHDLNKVYRYQLISVPGWAVDYANTGDRLDTLLGSTHKKLSLLMQYDIPLSPVLHNALICSEGGYSTDRPHAGTVFAKVVYLLDELSANVIDRLDAGRFWDSKNGGLNEEI